MSERWITTDGNEACAAVAYQLSDVIAIYPITPSSTMAELADEWASARQPNLWGAIPTVAEMQSEGGAAGAIHGALQAGGLATTFTASQGLLLMIPNMYKIAGELTPTVIHVSARALATHALSIFGDHSDVMAVRQTGFALLSSSSVQEAQDLALVAHASSLAARVPFLHFFDGFRTSHEIQKISAIELDTIRRLVDDGCVRDHRERALNPNRPVVRGTAQNPDVFFQGREASNPYYLVTPEIVRSKMRLLGELTGRLHDLFEYHGAPDATDIIVMMGSGAETARATVDALAPARIGVVTVKLYRPWSMSDFLRVLPDTVQRIAVLDRTKEPGAIGEPLYQDVVTALVEGMANGATPIATMPRVIGGRYGLGSKEFTPAMVKAVFEELASPSRRPHFTVGIVDDVTGLSLPVDEGFDVEPEGTVRAVFFGLGADGTVGANKNSVKIIGDEPDRWAQGYFVYDSKKSGAVTVSHLRFGRQPIHAPYLISRASIVACHQFGFLSKFDVVSLAEPGAIVLLNAPYEPDRLWTELPREVQDIVIDRQLRLFTIDAYRVAREAGLGTRINTIMQACFFALSGVLPPDEALSKIKETIKKTYSKRGDAVVAKNYAVVDAALAHLHRVAVPPAATAAQHVRKPVPDVAPDFVRRVTALMLANQGDRLPVSAFPIDGTWPTGTSKWEKRDIATELPVWDEALCIQCNKCAFVCPHAAIRVKVFDEAAVTGAPQPFKHVRYKGPEFTGQYSVQVAPEDCTGCGVCVSVCPVKSKADPSHRAVNMAPKGPIAAQERDNFEFFLGLPEPDRTRVTPDVKSTQFLQPLMEFSGACAGCGETPYLKLLTQLFGERAVIANATGCSSIFGGNLPTTPYTTNKDGRGPAWANSLFEDNAEFGYGMKLAIDQHVARARALASSLAAVLPETLVQGLLTSPQRTETELKAQRERIAELRRLLPAIATIEARELDRVAEYLLDRSVWIVGGDGWAYDIGYGGLDHVLASGADVNVLVLDTEVYSNTGGQQSKATPTGASAKFAASGKRGAKKDLGLMAMAYGHVYVAQIAFGAKDGQTLKALIEAESYPGPSLVIAYSHCIAHGYDLACGLEHQKLAADSGYWPLYRFDPRRVSNGQPALGLDSPPPKKHVGELMAEETRFRITQHADPVRYEDLVAESEARIRRRLDLYEKLGRS
ncbi:MAG TPA: pyruvate:ferredoxin (flavodoxin) oxidoreductase [Vicinamibacterales bacterium]|nr:pyruvate:ferredoxin (flavodoxin) oxidoreductase [Vicinamibacterales bacterium]